MLLERGEVVDIGSPASIARQYNELNFNRVRREAREHGGPETLRRAPVAEILSASFESADGETVVAATQGDLCSVRTEVQFHADVENPLFAISLDDDRGRRAFAASTALSDSGPDGTVSRHADGGDPSPLRELARTGALPPDRVGHRRRSRYRTPTDLRNDITTI